MEYEKLHQITDSRVLGQVFRKAPHGFILHTVLGSTALLEDKQTYYILIIIFYPVSQLRVVSDHFLE